MAYEAGGRQSPPHSKSGAGGSTDGAAALDEGGGSALRAGGSTTSTDSGVGRLEGGSVVARVVQGIEGKVGSLSGGGVTGIGGPRGNLDADARIKMLKQKKKSILREGIGVEAATLMANGSNGSI